MGHAHFGVAFRCSAKAPPLAPACRTMYLRFVMSRPQPDHLYERSKTTTGVERLHHVLKIRKIVKAGA